VEWSCEERNLTNDLELDWERLWFPGHEHPPLVQGYLPEKSTAFDLDPSEKGLPLTQLQESPCLILLGIPGMGKTTEMQRAATAARDRGDSVTFISMGRLSSVAELSVNLTKSDAAIPGRLVYIFLDGLDEVVVKRADLEAAIPLFLRTLLQSIPLQTLRVRISCRTAEWSSSLESDLRAIWNQEDVRVYELSQLRRSDVSAAARELVGSDSSAHFLSEIDKHNAAAFASRPVTLRLLLNIYRDKAGLPTEQVQLYRDGMLASIEEANSHRRQLRQTWWLDTSSKLIVAARIAVASIFSDSMEIWAGNDPNAPITRHLSILSIAGGHEPSLGSLFPVGTPELREVLLSPLFTPITANLFAWSHRTFPEYLAAYYLSEHALTAEQALTFFRGSTESANIPPQLHEVAAWLASMHPDFFRALLTSEPDILLRSDVASAAPNDRASLVRELLIQYDNGMLHDFNWDSRSRYSHLNHPDLAEQLAPYVSSKEKGVVVRRVAIDIAEANSVSSLAVLLADIALDQSDNHHIRAQAAAALSHLQEPEQSVRLLPLIKTDQTDDDDDLRGYALRALWPHYISLIQLLEALTEPKQSNYFGAYSFFISELQFDSINRDDFIPLLDWLTKISSDEDRSERFEKLIPRILSRAWEHIDDEHIRTRLAQFFIDTFNDFRNLNLIRGLDEFLSSAADSDTLRRRFITTLLSLAHAAGVRDLHWLSSNQSVGIVRDIDLKWLSNELAAGKSGLPSELTIDFLVASSFGKELDEIAYLWTAADSLPALHNALETAYSVALASTASAWQRDAFRRKNDAAAKDANAPKLDLQKKLRDDLDGLEHGSSARWWELNLVFFCDEKGNIDHHKEIKGNLARTSLWSELPTDLRERVIRTGTRYLHENEISSDAWLGKNVFHRPAVAGYRALRLLYSEDEKTFLELDESTWRKWTPTIWSTSFDDDQQEADARREIVRRSYYVSPAQVRLTIGFLLAHDNSQFMARTITNSIENSFDSDLGDLLYSILQERSNDEKDEQLTRFLIRKNYSPVTSATRESLTRGGGTSYSFLTPEAQFVSAAAALLEYDTVQSWPAFETLTKTDEEVARKVIRKAANSWSLSDRPIGATLSEDEAANLFIWLHRAFPRLPDDSSTEARYYSDVDHIQHLKDAVLRNLVTRGTTASVTAVTRIAATLPEVEWLKFQIVDARSAASARLWKRREPADIISVLSLFQPYNLLRSTKATIASATAAYQTANSEVSEQETIDHPLQAETIPIPSSALAPSAITQRRILAVATEWRSGHGGISTLNRDLCAALAAIGHTVTCLVVNASQVEIDAASALKVRLVAAPSDPILPDEYRLLLFNREMLDGFEPELVIGHDHKTGSAARHIARHIYKVPYLHFVHTLPEDAEQYKTRKSSTILTGSKKAEAQLELCRLADLIVAVGPRIHRVVQTSLGFDVSVPIAEFRPGLDRHLMSNTVDLTKPRMPYCLFLGRLEDGELKGARLACKMIRVLNSDWSWPAPDRPRLVMRGFDPDCLDRDVEAIGGIDEAKPYLLARAYTEDASVIANEICSSSVVIMPSKREAFGLVALEGIAAGVPILVTSESGIGDLLLQLKSDIGQSIVDACVADVDGDPDVITRDWASKIQRVMANPSLAFRQAASLRSVLGPLLSWDNTAKKLSDDFERILR
jgi:glycosyltransferase involved in cell wall biosynthesis